MIYRRNIFGLKFISVVKAYNHMPVTFVFGDQVRQFVRNQLKGKGIEGVYVSNWQLSTKRYSKFTVATTTGSVNVVSIHRTLSNFLLTMQLTKSFPLTRNIGVYPLLT